MGDRDRNYDRNEGRQFSRDDYRDRDDDWRSQQSRDRSWLSRDDRDRDASRGDYNRDYSNRDYNRDREPERSYGTQSQDWNYRQNSAGAESRRFPATFGSYEDQRYSRDWNRDRTQESQRNYGYGAGQNYGQSYGQNYDPSYGGYGSNQSDWYGNRDRNEHNARYGAYGRDESRGRDRGESFGHQLREAGQRFVGKVKRAFRGPKGYKRSDDRIREDVNDRLSQQDHLDPSEIEVTVTNGEVTLTGTVDTRQEKFVAEEIADDVSGVSEVHNQLRIGRAQQQTSASTETTSAYGNQSGTDASRGRNARAQ